MYKFKIIIMKKFTKFLRAVACIACLLTVSNVSAQITWPPLGSGMLGDGTENDPYQITTYSELYYLAYYVNEGNGPLTEGVYYKLMSDITSPNRNWPQIGDNATSDATFRGNFDGNGKVVYLHIPGGSYVGLFGYVSYATIHNLGIEECSNKGDQYVGGLIGYADNSTIDNCYVVGSVTGNSSVGGLIGISNNSTVSNCYAICEVSGDSNIGGLVGVNNGTIQRSYSGGNVTEKGTGRQMFRNL